IFELLGISPEEQRAKFGFLLDALAMGAPPHGGIASGLDRLSMALLDEPYIRDTLAFPKNQAGIDPMTGAPSDVTQKQLDGLGKQVVDPREKRSPTGGPISSHTDAAAISGPATRGRKSAADDTGTRTLPRRPRPDCPT